jgi:small subunit ribosomal protein S20
MATHASAEKRNRQRIIRTERNSALKSFVRKALKQAREAIDQGAANASELVKGVHTLLDSAASKNVLPSQRASRLKSRLSLALGKIAAGKPADGKPAAGKAAAGKAAAGKAAAGKAAAGKAAAGKPAAGKPAAGKATAK